MVASAIECGTRGTLEDLDLILFGSRQDIVTYLDGTEGERIDTAVEMLAAGDVEAFMALRLRESVALQLAGRYEAAYDAVCEVWAEADRLTPVGQALILTQLAACRWNRGDLRGGLRAGRRAEALLMACDDEATTALLAARAWLLRRLEQAGSATGLLRARIAHSWAALERSVTDAASEQRLDSLRTAFLDARRPPHWALVHCRRWQCVLGANAPAVSRG